MNPVFQVHHASPNVTNLRPSTMAEAAAQYKKKDGKITISADARTVSWRTNGGGLTVDIDIADVTSTSPWCFKECCGLRS
jgi:hypothetical protein